MLMDMDMPSTGTARGATHAYCCMDIGFLWVMGIPITVCADMGAPCF